MGEVWRARDSKLGREVAIKTLPEEFANDAERLARFEREAKLLASLNHPNIAAIYGLEEDNGTRFLVLELVEGDTLADRLKRGAIPIEESLTLALQITEALEAAHEKGVIHRDLKPLNIKVTPEGKIKVLDFGLAKAFMGDGSDVNLSQSPTLSMAATQQGVILGTAAYMSPEQARGVTVDKRADIWAFGCVLLEILTGRQAFPGDLASDILAAVIRAEPAWVGYPSEVHSNLKNILSRCLEKDVRARWQDIGDVRHDLEQVAADPKGAQLPKLVTASRGRQAQIAWVIAALLAVAIIGLLVQPRSTPGTPGTALTFEINLPDGVHVGVDSEHPAIALSPDGSQLIVVGVRDGVSRLYRRNLNDAGFEAVEIEGTEGAGSPFFSPGGGQLAFFSGNLLRAVSPASGVPYDIAGTTSITVNRGTAWVDAGTFVRSPSADDALAVLEWRPEVGVLSRSDFTMLTETPAPSSWPAPLPDGRGVLFADQSRGPGADSVGLFSLESREFVSLFNGGTSPRYSLTGHILYARAGSLYARTFDANSNAVGEERLVTRGLQMRDTGAAQFAVSATGTLAYVSGDLTATRHEMVWLDLEGNVVDTIDMGDRRLSDPRLSPDGSQISLTSVTGANLDVFVWDLIRRDLTPWTTDPGEDFGAVWHPERGLAFATEIQRGGPALGWMSGLNAEPEEIFERPGLAFLEFPMSWSPDGRLLSFGTTEPGGDEDAFVLDFETREAQPFVATPDFNESAPAFSPDGNWVAYVSNRSGISEIWIAQFPGAETAQRVSTRNGGTGPVWARDSGNLFYRESNRLMLVTFSGGPGVPDPPLELFIDTFERFGIGAGKPNYDVSPDGQRILMVRRRNPLQPTTVRVVVNWPEVYRFTVDN